jgi:hypothetical protein
VTGIHHSPIYQAVGECKYAFVSSSMPQAGAMGGIPLTILDHESKVEANSELDFLQHKSLARRGPSRRPTSYNHLLMTVMIGHTDIFQRPCPRCPVVPLTHGQIPFLKVQHLHGALPQAAQGLSKSQREQLRDPTFTLPQSLERKGCLTRSGILGKLG